MATEKQSPAREPTYRGRGGRGGGRAGRGGGRGRGGSKLAVSSGLVAAAKLAAAKAARGGSRRGRAKTFADSRVQAAYERQRDLKANFQTVAHAIKPVLQELADRSVDALFQNYDRLKSLPHHQLVVSRLQQRLDDKINLHDCRLQHDLQLAKHRYEADNQVDDMEEQFYESQKNRAGILNALCKKGLPVDIRDDQYQYKIITDHHLDRDFGIYQCYKNGHLVPYPSRIKDTNMWKRGRDVDAALSTLAPNVPVKGRGRGRGANKRRAQDQPDGQPTPKKSTRATDDAALERQHMAPVPPTPTPAKGLLASAAEAEAHPNGVTEEESAPASPEPAALVNGALAIAKDASKLHARKKSPPLPKNLGEPDSHGVRLYTQRGSREKSAISRLMAPPLFIFNDWEIGFRDTYNDSSKGHTRAKRGKYLDTPNNTGWHFDQWCNGYDYSTMKPQDFDQELVEAYGLHPRYGFFLPTSKNDSIQSDSYIISGKPVVFIAKPSGRMSYASRSFIPAMNHRRFQEAPTRHKLAATLRRFGRTSDIDHDDMSINEYLPSFMEWKKKSLGTAVKEMKKRPVKEIEDSETDEEVTVEETSELVPNSDQSVQPGPSDPADSSGLSGLSILTYASAFVTAEENAKPAPPPSPPKPARYDAIRDVFTDSKPTAAPVREPLPLHLGLLVELCNVEARAPGGTGVALEPEFVSSAKREETPKASNSVDHLLPSQQVEQKSLFDYSSRGDRAYPQPPSSGTLLETSSSYPSQDRALPLPAPVDYTSHYPPPPPPGPSITQDQSYWYTAHDSRDQMTSSRPADHGYGHGRLSGYGSEIAPPPQSYARGPYYSQQSPPAPPPPAMSLAQHYGGPAPPSSRMSFSHISSEPLPPLRPARRNQSMPDEFMHENGRATMSSMYYQPGAVRSTSHRSIYSTEPPAAPMQPLADDRLLLNYQQTQGYMGANPSGYAHQVNSPTFASPGLPDPTGQSSPGTPQGPHGGMHHHRSTPSGSSDAGSNKYRKLQPAPVPAHRNWANKPELKTIPYDHKETGASAELPSSGPTQIRGWNVNQPRKRSRMEKHERAELSNDGEDSR